MAVAEVAYHTKRFPTFHAKKSCQKEEDSGRVIEQEQRQKAMGGGKEENTCFVVPSCYIRVRVGPHGVAQKRRSAVEMEAESQRRWPLCK